jgi:XTP/dITP diphosphohydrolase
LEIVLATRNAHKLAEVRRILQPFRVTVAPLPRGVVLPPEDGDSFAANAMTKARAASVELKRSVIADDSGIEADALGGRPGVRSARFAGEHATDQENLNKLIAEVPAGSGLRYVCSIAFVDGVTERIFFGECRGHMAAAPSGEGGFGYDPVFLPDDEPEPRTMAQLSEHEKDLISHRGRALRDFAWWFLGDRLGLRP